MSAFSISLIAFACIFGATLLSLYLRTILPSRHLSTDTRDTVRLSMGVIGTMAALVLGLLIASAKSSYDDRSNQVKQLTVNIIVLDQILNQYGPETRELRNLLRGGVASLADRVWGRRDPATATDAAFAMSAEAEAFLRRIEELKPQTELQRSMQARAITTVTSLAETRLLLYAQGNNSIPLPFLVLLVFWLAIIFSSFALFVQPNPIVITAFFVCALSASGALFLILELVRPFTGLMPISDHVLRNALALL